MLIQKQQLLYKAQKNITEVKKYICSNIEIDKENIWVSVGGVLIALLSKF